MANQYTNKVIINGQAVIDLSEDTVVASGLKKGLVAHDKSGAKITGTNTYDADTSDATAAATEILSGKIAYGYGGKKLTGTMANKAGANVEVTNLSGTTIPAGYYDGSGKAKISSTEAAKIIPANIKEGINILGVVGTHQGEEHITAEKKTVTPTFSAQSVVPSEASYLSEVTVEAIPVTYTDNAAGGKTCTVG